MTARVKAHSPEEAVHTLRAYIPGLSRLRGMEPHEVVIFFNEDAISAADIVGVED